MPPLALNRTLWSWHSLKGNLIQNAIRRFMLAEQNESWIKFKKIGYTRLT